MVKGISRRVIVVRSPDPRFFEQAIFLMKEDAFHNSTVSADQVVAEARQAAAGYLRRSAGTCSSTWRSWLPNSPYPLSHRAEQAGWSTSAMLLHLVKQMPHWQPVFFTSEKLKFPN